MIDIDIISQLIPNPITMLVQLCSTLVLFLLARKFLWASVKNFLQKRSEKMQEDLKQSENARSAAETDRQAAAEQLSQAGARSEQIIEAAVREAKVEKDSIIAQANKEAESMRKKAEEQIEAQREQMFQSLQQDIVDIAITAAGKIIQNKDGEDLDHDAVDAFVKEVSGS